MDSDEEEETKQKKEEKNRNNLAGDYNFYDEEYADTRGQKKLKGMLKTFTTILENSGFVDTINKVFILTKEIDFLPINMFLMTMNAVAFMQYDVSVNSLTRKFRDKPIDGPPFVVGIVTIFKHFHPTNFMKYLLLCSHYIKGAILFSADQRKN